MDLKICDHRLFSHFDGVVVAVAAEMSVLPVNPFRWLAAPPSRLPFHVGLTFGQKYKEGSSPPPSPSKARADGVYKIPSAVNLFIKSLERIAGGIAGVFKIAFLSVRASRESSASCRQQTLSNILLAMTILFYWGIRQKLLVGLDLRSRGQARRI